MMHEHKWKTTVLLLGSLLAGALLSTMLLSTAKQPVTPATVQCKNVWEYSRNDSGEYLGNGRISPKFIKLSLIEAEILVHYRLTKSDINCLNVQRFGKEGDGGYDICLDPPYALRNRHCLVYSFGISHDWSFDEAIDRHFSCEIHSFDPSIGLTDHKHKEPNMFFHNLGLWGSNTRNKQGWQMKDLATIINDLGHTNRVIDYLKVDIEGAEWPLLRHIVSSGIYRQVKQLVIEAHTPRTVRSGKAMSVIDHAEVYASLEDLEAVGFRKFRHHTNNNCCGDFVTFTSPAATGGMTHCCYEVFYINSRFE